jgi:hypothetical protein
VVLGLDLVLLIVELLPQRQRLTQLIQGLRRLGYPGGGEGTRVNKGKGESGGAVDGGCLVVSSSISSRLCASLATMLRGSESLMKMHSKEFGIKEQVNRMDRWIDEAITN